MYQVSCDTTNPPPKKPKKHAAFEYPRGGCASSFTNPNFEPPNTVYEDEDEDELVSWDPKYVKVV